MIFHPTDEVRHLAGERLYPSPQHLEHPPHEAVRPIVFLQLPWRAPCEFRLCQHLRNRLIDRRRPRRLRPLRAACHSRANKRRRHSRRQHRQPRLCCGTQLNLNILPRGERPAVKTSQRVERLEYRIDTQVRDPPSRREERRIEHAPDTSGEHCFDAKESLQQPGQRQDHDQDIDENRHPEQRQHRQRQVVLLWPPPRLGQRLPPQRAALLHLALPVQRQHARIMVKGARDPKWQRGQRRHGQHKETGRLHRRLRHRHPHHPPPGPRGRLPLGGHRQEMRGKDRLPALAPDQRRGHQQREIRQMLRCKGAPAHVRPEVEERQHQRRGSNVIHRAHPRRAAPQQRHRLFDQVQRRLLRGCAPLAHWVSRCHSVPS